MQSTVDLTPLIKALRKQKYQLVGSHSAVKKCRWLHESLTKGRVCYKQKFYGVQSHRCVQMTPTLACNMRCKFCWRIHPEDLGLPAIPPSGGWDEPEEIVRGCVEAQLRILSGYGSQVKEGRIGRERYLEALSPKHAAISLDGEPTLYPRLGELIGEFRRRGFTTFLVTNGTRPEALAALDEEPSQLYVSIYAPDEETFKEVCRPAQAGAWRKLKETLSLLPSFSCPTVARLTLVRGANMGDPKGYARLLERPSPTYIEPKAYMFVGHSRLRLSFENMPSHEEVVSFSKALAAELSYRLIGESKESRVALLSRLNEPMRISPNPC